MGRELQVIAPRGVARSFDPVALVDEWRADMAERVAAGELAAATATTYLRGKFPSLDWHEHYAPGCAWGRTRARLDGCPLQEYRRTEPRASECQKKVLETPAWAQPSGEHSLGT